MQSGHFIGTTLLVKGHRYTIVETEYYGDDDPYTHKAKQQLETRTFYFHRVNDKGFKEGSFRGLDITVGDGTHHRAYLIRSIRAEGGAVTEGPCLVVNTILQHFGKQSVKDFYAVYQPTNPTMSVDGDASAELSLVTDNSEEKIDMYARVGLRFKAIPGYSHETVLRACVSPQRYVLSGLKLKKGRYGMIKSVRMDSIKSMEELFGLSVPYNISSFTELLSAAKALQ